MFTFSGETEFFRTCLDLLFLSKTGLIGIYKDLNDFLSQFWKKLYKQLLYTLLLIKILCKNVKHMFLCHSMAVHEVLLIIIN